jgi:cytochrome c oxidase assembly factor CtaG
MLGRWTFDPLQLGMIGVLAVAYARRTATLHARGHPVPRVRIALFASGLGLLLLAVASPVHELAEEYLAFHMLQHVVLGDLAPLLVLCGLTGPLLRPLLALGPVGRLRVLANPVVGFAVWAAILLTWHLPLLYDAAVRHESVHALEHVSFFAAGIAVWLPVVETLPAPEWFGTGAKLVYVVGVRSVESLLGNVLLWVAGTPLYGVYVRPHDLIAVSPSTDQSLAGAVMLVEGMLVTLPLLAVLFLRLQVESEARQTLVEQGVEPHRARRAVRYRRADGLTGPLYTGPASSHGSRSGV